MSEKIKTGYKVVYSELGEKKLESVCAPSPAKVTYKVGRWTRRNHKDGPLSLFGSLQEAEYFIAPFFSCAGTPLVLSVYTCKYVESEDNDLWFYMSGVETRAYNPLPLPSGTLFADKLKLVGKPLYQKEL